MKLLVSIITLMLANLDCTLAFTSQGQAFVSSRRHQRFTGTTELDAMVPFQETQEQVFSSLSSASTYISTVSADIDSISDDSFGLVFAGGMAVMFGGVLSTLIVGFLLESGNSYASVVADSYAQGGDEAFWESLSPEDQEKTKELMAKLKKSKEGGGDVPSTVKVSAETAPVQTEEEKKELSMFSDYE